MLRRLLPALLAVLAAAPLSTAGAATPRPRPHDVVLYASNETLFYYDTVSHRRGVYLPASRYLNGQICINPATHQLFEGSDVPAKNGSAPNGFSHFTQDRRYVGFLHDAQQNDSLGCAFDRHGNFIAGDPGGNNPADPEGILLEWFAPDYRQHCVLRTHLPQVGVFAWNGSQLLIPLTGGNPSSSDPVQQGSRIVAATNFPTDAAHCHAPTFQTFIEDPTVKTPIGIAHDPKTGGWAVSSVLAPAEIVEYPASGGTTVGTPLVPLTEMPRNPLGLSFDRAGNLYYVELALSLGPNGFDTQSNAGHLYQVSFGPGHQPSTPHMLDSGLSFADGCNVVRSDTISLPR